MPAGQHDRFRHQLGIHPGLQRGAEPGLERREFGRRPPPSAGAPIARPPRRRYDADATPGPVDTAPLPRPTALGPRAGPQDSQGRSPCWGGLCPSLPRTCPATAPTGSSPDRNPLSRCSSVFACASLSVGAGSAPNTRLLAHPLKHGLGLRALASACLEYKSARLLREIAVVG